MLVNYIYFMIRLLFIFFIVPFSLFSQNLSYSEEFIINKSEKIKNQFANDYLNSISCIIAKPIISNYLQGKGNIFFGDKKWNSSVVVSRGISYKIDYLRYDIKNNILQVLKFTSNGAQILELISINISSFTLDNHFFMYLNRTDIPGKHKLESKYYERVIDENYLKIYRNWQKSNYKLSDGTYSDYTESSTVFAIMKGVFYEINSLESFLKLIKVEYHEAVKNYLISKQINLDKQIADSEIVEVVKKFNLNFK